MRFVCSKCGGIIDVDSSERGNPVGCGHCNKFVVVPEKKIATNIIVNGDFVLKEKLGQGGVGTVYKAHQISLDRPVALKILMEQFIQDKTFVEDFIREARSAARLNHPNIVQAFAVGQDEGLFFCAMELVVGETLKDVIGRDNKVTVDFSIQVMRQMAEALDFAWKNQKLVHRDIKPDNIMITASGVSKLADLGLARVATDVEEDSEEIMGTPQYISPEQLIGAKTDVRTDIYSLGATWYHCITGDFPFDGDSPQDIAKKHLEEKLTPPIEVNPDIPENISMMICKMMAKHPDDRYRDAEELLADLNLVAQDPKNRSRKVGSSKRKKKEKTFTTSIGTKTGKVKTFTTSIKTGTGKVSTLTTKTGAVKMTNTHNFSLKGTQTQALKNIERTVQMDSLELDENVSSGKQKLVPVIIIAVLGLITLLLFALKKSDLEKRVALLIEKGVKSEKAQLIAEFEDACVKSNVIASKNFNKALELYSSKLKSVSDYKKHVKKDMVSFLELATENEVRVLRKKLKNK